jgi:hypothetical protein
MLSDDITQTPPSIVKGILLNHVAADRPCEEEMLVLLDSKVHQAHT